MLRAGFGIFYGRQGSLGADGRGINNFPYNRSVTAQSAGGQPPFLLAAGVPGGFLGSPTAPPPPNVNWTVWQQDFPEPQVAQWNFALQQELTRDLSFTIAYVGSGTSYLMDALQLERLRSRARWPPRASRRPIPRWNTISFHTPFGHSTYHGLDLQFEKRYAAGLSFSASYTWSHSLDNIAEQFGSGGGGLQSTKDFRSARGNSNFDLRHRFVHGRGLGVAVRQRPSLDESRRIPEPRARRLAALRHCSPCRPGITLTITVPNSRTILGATAIADWWPDRIANPRLDYAHGRSLVQHQRVRHLPRNSGRQLPLWQRRPRHSERRRAVQYRCRHDEERSASPSASACNSAGRLST